MLDTGVNWCLEVRAWGIRMQNRLYAQRWANGINMWPNAVLTFSHSFGVQIVCLGIFGLLAILIKKYEHLIK